MFATSYTRNVLMPDGTRRQELVTDYAYGRFRELFGDDTELPAYFVTAQSLSPAEHVAVQATAQAYIDSSISKTINCPPGISFDDFKDVYRAAYEKGCKGCTTYRPNPVTGAVLATEPDNRSQTARLVPIAGAQTGSARTALALAPRTAERAEGGDVVYMTKPLDRPGELPGHTYKVRWPDLDHAFYITINDIEQDGRKRPFEIFINSKNMEHYAWTVALTRMISAVFRRGGDVSFVVEELKAVFDPARRPVDGRALHPLAAGGHRRSDRAPSDRYRVHVPARQRRKRCAACGCRGCRSRGRGRSPVPALLGGRTHQPRRLRHLHQLRLLPVRVRIADIRRFYQECDQ